MKRNKRKYERRLTLKSRLLSWVLAVLFGKTNLEEMFFVLSAYSEGIKNLKEFDYQKYLELKRKIEVVTK